MADWEPEEVDPEEVEPEEDEGEVFELGETVLILVVVD